MEIRPHLTPLFCWWSMQKMPHKMILSAPWHKQSDLTATLLSVSKINKRTYKRKLTTIWLSLKSKTLRRLFMIHLPQNDKTKRASEIWHTRKYPSLRKTRCTPLLTTMIINRYTPSQICPYSTKTASALVTSSNSSNNFRRENLEVSTRLAKS